MRLFVICLLTCLASPAVTAPAPAPAQEAAPKSLYELFGVPEPGLRGAELDAAVKAAEPYPLGSEKNPVRASGPNGQRAYIARLRCSDGRAPRIEGRGSGGFGPFGGIIDFYGLTCEGGEPAKASIVMDMYHDHVETRPVAGFTIVAP